MSHSIAVLQLIVELVDFLVLRLLLLFVNWHHSFLLLVNCSGSQTAGERKSGDASPARKRTFLRQIVNQLLQLLVVFRAVDEHPVDACN